jgi:hypothetical protein
MMGNSVSTNQKPGNGHDNNNHPKTTRGIPTTSETVGNSHDSPSKVGGIFLGTPVVFHPSPNYTLHSGMLW